jgi:hypothetical protein
MIKPQFLAVPIFGKNPESLILLDLITTDNAFPSPILSGPADVERLVFGSLCKLLPFAPDPKGTQAVKVVVWTKGRYKISIWETRKEKE